MKRILSTWMAAARDILWKLLLILPVMAAAEIGLLLHTMERIRELMVDGYMNITFGYLINESKLPYVFFFTLFAVAAVCCLQGCQFSGKKLYTLQRLPLGEYPTTLLWSVVHLSCFVILWAVQLTMVFVLWRIFAMEFGSGNPGLELFVEFYKNGFLHSLLPLADISRWIMAGVYYVTLAYTTACFGFFQRRGKFRPEIGILLVLYSFMIVSVGDVTGNYLMAVACPFFMVSQTGSIWGVYHNAETD